MKRLKLLFMMIVVLICAVIGIWFAQDNSALVGIIVFGFDLGSLPLGICLIVTFCLGVLMALFATVVPVLRVQRKNKRLEKELSRLKSSVQESSARL